MFPIKLCNLSAWKYAFGVTISTYLAELAVPLDFGISKSIYVSAR